MSKYASKQFWVDTFDRAIATFAQALVASNVLESTGLIGVDWAGLLSLSGGTALASVLTSVAFRGGQGERPEDVPSKDAESDV